MPTVETMDSDFEGQSFCTIATNSRTFIYCLSYEAEIDWIYGYTTVKNFRFSIFGRSMHKIGEIEVPCYSYHVFNPENEEICWLDRVLQTPPDIEPYVDPNECCLLTLVTFGLSNGTVNRFYHVTNDVCYWSLMRKIDGELLAYPDEQLNDYMQIYAVSYLDNISGAFGLTPYLRLPFYNTLRSMFRRFSNYKDQITVTPSHTQGQILYFKRGKCWVLENYYSGNGNDEVFKIFETYCNGPLIMEFGRVEKNWAFRILVADQNNVWKVVFKGSFPPDFDEETAFGWSYNGQLLGILKHHNTKLSVDFQSCMPCTLLEACISILWPFCSRMNPLLNDYEICSRLGLSKFVNMDVHFGEHFP